ncbi:ABC transporter permease subunit [Agromyces atrinae]|uniref:ABC transporter permease subunit n=1 Tax=Agromyces atrinae TaxID=592376 RepID=A0A4Q2M861_9MICO|nr:ABC transporter permease subunit [Agromyces atrinae]MCI2957123.1 ABC transporter permease subunit [Agromyces atrinae]NYD67513.1 putative spermidine/putrescine transport system permease protein [Agromyces atrinae]RXZ88269.1 ABC transporter permease subunit [Agromyces atrinae]
MSARGIGPSRATRWVVAVVLIGLFLVPIVSMIEYTTRDGSGGHSLVNWLALFDPANESKYRPIWVGLGNSLVLALVSVAIVLFLLAPTMVLISLRFPGLRRIFEFLVLLPISIPAIVLVVGLAPIYLVIGRTFGTGIWTLAFAYGITVLPFAYRAIQASIDATDMKTLAEAARTLGAGWPTILGRVLAPNLRPGLLAASLISVAVVLGEFTIASLLNRQNLQTALVVVGKQDPYASVILSLLALAFAFVLLVVIGRAGAARRTSKGRS